MSRGLPPTVRSCAVVAVRKPRHVSPLPAEATPAMMELRCFAPRRRNRSGGDPGSAERSGVPGDSFSCRHSNPL